MTGSADFFTPGVQTAGPGGPIAILADAIDFKTGEYLSISRGFDPVDAAVQVALRTVRGSGSAVEDVGQKFHEQSHVTAGLQTFFREEVAFALRHLVESKEIRLVSVVIPTGDDWAEAQVKYQNLISGGERIASLGPVS